jgi:hypothetical protein
MVSKRLCRKCNKKIPNWFIINGDRKSLRNRKFCLDCSPYMGHNTKPDDPSKPSEKREHYWDWSNERKRMSIVSTLKRGLDRKRALIEMAGSKCLNCEYKYNGCERALSFHHRNPAEKSFGLTMNNLWGQTWEKILKEFVKCDMLCLVCHAELEDKIARAKKTDYRKSMQCVHSLENAFTAAALGSASGG